MCKRFIFGFVLVVFCLNCVFAQHSKIDSLLNLLKTDKEDTIKVKHLIDLCWKYKNKGDFGKGMTYGNAALELAGSVTFAGGKGWTKGMAQAYNDLGIVSEHQGNYAKALEYHFRALKIRKESGDKLGLAQTYNNLGIVYNNQSDFDKALESFFASLKIQEQIGNKQNIAGLYGNIGVICKMQGNNDKALENYFLSLKMYEETGDKRGIANSYNNIGVIYNDLGRYDKALESYFVTLRMNMEMGDQYGIATSNINIGVVYKALGKYNNALENYFASLKISEEIGDKSNSAAAHINIGDVFLLQHKLNDAKNQLISGLNLAREVGAKDNVESAYETLSACDSATGDWKGAYQYQKLFKQLSDSVFNAENSKRSAEMSARFDSEKQETKIKLLENEKEKQAIVSGAENKRNRTVLIAVLCGLSLMILFSMFMFNRWNVTRRQKNIIELQKAEVDKQRDLADSRRVIAEEQRHVIEIQKKEVEHQKELVEEHQKEIIDSITYAKRLQEAILPPNEYLKKYLPDCFILYKPKDIVAGDFYWMEVIDDLIFIAAADCTGHGVPGAMVSIVCSNALNRTIKEFGLRNTGEILDKVTELVMETFEKSDANVADGMDISLLALNKSTGQIYWSGANNPLWYICNRELKSITANKQPIGKHDNRKPFVSHRLNLLPGTIFYLFTDGYADQFGGARGKKFKYKQLEEKLMAISGNSMEDQKDTLDKTFTEWKGKLEQVDDVCIIGIKI